MGEVISCYPSDAEDLESGSPNLHIPALLEYSIQYTVHEPYTSIPFESHDDIKG
jgi:hypothetical protein